jgi:hypothetical protein
MSFYTMAFMGMAPFGSLLAGGLAARIGAPATLLAGGVVTIAGAGYFASKLAAMKGILHPMYRSMGIMPTDEPPAEEP